MFLKSATQNIERLRMHFCTAWTGALKNYKPPDVYGYIRTQLSKKGKLQPK